MSEETCAIAYTTQTQTFNYYVLQHSFAGLHKFISHLTHSIYGRKVFVNRVWLTPFSAPLELTRSPEVNGQPIEEQETFFRDKLLETQTGAAAEFAAIVDEFAP